MIIEVAGDDKAKREKSARVIVEEADRLASLVSDVLDLSKIRSGIQALEMQAFDLSAYLEEMLARFGYLTETQGYCLDAQIEQGLFTHADKMKIGQVLYNLIGNAVNYTGDDKKVKVVLERKENCIRFAVSDTGAGIAEDELAGIWDRYYRSSEAHKRPVRGTGLGLSIVKTILERHQFIFGVDSVLGQGSTFYVLFPIGEIEQKE
jgi:signal transduction histidine kinase